MPETDKAMAQGATGIMDGSNHQSQEPRIPDRRSRREQITLRDIAAAADVCEMTVSRTLRQTGDVSEKTRKKILSVVDELGFVPNRIAESLATSTSNLIAVIVPTLRNQVFTEVLAGVTGGLERIGFKAVIGISDYCPMKEESLIRSMISWRPSGLIVSNLSHTRRARNIMANAGIPVVEMMETTSRPIDACVGVDHRRAGAVMARHFIRRGYRRIGYPGWNGSDLAAQKRFEGFAGELAKGGLDFAAVGTFEDGPDIAVGKSGLQRLLRDHGDLDAVYFPNDMAAVGGLLYCQEAGIDVPGRLAVGGFGGLVIGKLLPRPLTTVHIERFEIGRKSADIIVARLNAEKVRRINRIEARLVTGGTS